MTAPLMRTVPAVSTLATLCVAGVWWRTSVPESLNVKTATPPLVQDGSPFPRLQISV